MMTCCLLYLSGQNQDDGDGKDDDDKGEEQYDPDQHIWNDNLFYSEAWESSSWDDDGHSYDPYWWAGGNDQRHYNGQT